MPVFDSLKNAFGHHNHKDKNANNNSNATSSSHRHTASSSSSKHAHTSSRDMPQPPIGGNPAAHHHHAPASAQNAAYTAFAPEPHSRSEAHGFVGANPAAAVPAGGGVAPAKGHEKEAQALVDKANQRSVDERNAIKAQAIAIGVGPSSGYDGLPERFELGEKMGDGAFSNVYKAYDHQSRRKVAIKCVRKFELNANQDGGKHLHGAVKKKPRATERANILKEVQIMRGLQHDGIIELLSFTESRDHYFLVLELMEGGELFHQIVKLTYFSEELSRHVIKQVADGIRYLHEVKGVVHRDIKPENLLFESIPIIPSKHPRVRPYDEEKEDEGEFVPGIGGGGIGRVKIADFGLSKIVWNEETMTPCGTVGYTAPEIVKDERYSKSVDMWALGCVLYTLLCGFPPFYDESINVLTEKVARGYYTFLSPWWDDISASSKDLITHLLCVDPDKRYTIDEFLAHPWMHEKAPPPQVSRADLQKLGAKVGTGNVPLDSPLLSARAGREMGKSPGLATLREAFDITYAVHRMEEEGARRRAYNGPGGAGARGFLHGLNEDDEEEEEDAAELQKKAKARAAAQQQQQAAAQYQGRGGADPKLAERALYDGRAGLRDRGGGGGGFELKLDNATLLGRRKPVQ